MRKILIKQEITHIRGYSTSSALEYTGINYIVATQHNCEKKQALTRIYIFNLGIINHSNPEYKATDLCLNFHCWGILNLFIFTTDSENIKLQFTALLPLTHSYDFAYSAELQSYICDSNFLHGV